MNCHRDHRPGCCPDKTWAPSILIPRGTGGVLLLSAVAEFLRARPAAAAENPKPKPTQEVFKNIQVLKDLPAEQLIPVMREYNASLGVKCDFCHVISPNHTGFEKDDKKMKQTARHLVACEIGDDHRIAALELALNLDDAGRQQAAPTFERIERTGSGREQ